MQAHGALLTTAVQNDELNAAVAGASDALTRRLGELRGALAGVETRLDAVQSAAVSREEVVTRADLKRKLLRVRSDIDAALAAVQREAADAVKMTAAGLQSKGAAKQLEERIGVLESALPKGLRGISDKMAASLQLKADAAELTAVTRRLEEALTRSTAAAVSAAAAAEAAASAEHAAERAARGATTFTTAAAVAADGFVVGAMRRSSGGSAGSVWPPVVIEEAQPPPPPQQQQQQPSDGDQQQASFSPRAVPLVTPSSTGQTTAQHRTTPATSSSATATPPQRLRGASQNAKRAREEARRQQQLRALSAPLPQRQQCAGLGALLLVGYGAETAAAGGLTMPLSHPAEAAPGSQTATTTSGSTQASPHTAGGSLHRQRQLQQYTAGLPICDTVSLRTPISTGGELRLLLRPGGGGNVRYSSSSGQPSAAAPSTVPPPAPLVTRLASNTKPSGRPPR